MYFLKNPKDHKHLPRMQVGLANNRKHMQQNVHKFTDNAPLGTTVPGNLLALSRFYIGKGKGTLNISDFKGKKKRVYIYTHTDCLLHAASPFSLPQGALCLPSSPSWQRLDPEPGSKVFQSLKSLGKCNGEGEMLNKNYPKIHLPSDTASCFSWMTPHANSHK